MSAANRRSDLPERRAGILQGVGTTSRMEVPAIHKPRPRELADDRHWS